MSSLLHLLGHGTGCRWTAHLAGTKSEDIPQHIHNTSQCALCRNQEALQLHCKSQVFAITPTTRQLLLHHCHSVTTLNHTTTPPQQGSEQNEDVFLFVLLLQFVGNFPPSQIPVSCPYCSKPFHQEDNSHKPYYTRSPKPGPS